MFKMATPADHNERETMFCEKCGREVKDDAVFCSKCGQRFKADEDGTPDASVAATAAKHRSPWPILFVVILLAILASGGVFLSVTNQKAAAAKADEQTAAAKAEAKAEAKDAVDGVGKINAAVGVGVTYQTYMTQLSDAAAAVEAYQPSDTAGVSIRDSLAKAVKYSAVAGDAWNDDIQDEFTSSTYKSDPELALGTGYVSVDDVRQAAWLVAGTAYDEAKTAISAY